MVFWQPFGTRHYLILTSCSAFSQNFANLLVIPFGWRKVQRFRTVLALQISQHTLSSWGHTMSKSLSPLHISLVLRALKHKVILILRRLSCASTSVFTYLLCKVSSVMPAFRTVRPPVLYRRHYVTGQSRGSTVHVTF